MERQYITKYIADDGKEFFDEEECFFYELELMIDKVPENDRITLLKKSESGGLESFGVLDVIDEDETPMENMRTLDLALNNYPIIYVPDYEANKEIIDTFVYWFGLYSEIDSSGHWMWINGFLRNIDRISDCLNHIIACITRNSTLYDIYTEKFEELENLMKV